MLAHKTCLVAQTLKRCVAECRSLTPPFFPFQVLEIVAAGASRQMPTSSGPSGVYGS